MIPAIHRTGSPHQPWHDFCFDGLSLSFRSEKKEEHNVCFDDIVAEFKKSWKEKVEVCGGTATKFFDCKGIPEDGVENLVFEKYDYLGVTFDFSTAKSNHRIRFFHTGEGKVEF